MNFLYDPKENERVALARDSFSGRLLTDAQFDEAMALTGIVEGEIRKSGAFKEKLGDYAYAFARTERFDAMKAETIIRDLFKARTGQSMNQMREGFAEREAKLTGEQISLAYDFALAVGKMVEEGDKISFNRAFAHQAAQLAGTLKITDVSAKNLMREEFVAAEGREFYEWGKEIEQKFYRPQIEAEKQQRAERSQEDESGQDRSRSRQNGRSRSGDREEDSARRRGQSSDDSGRREARRSRPPMSYRR